ncbi:hypothetical protein [Sphingobium sp. SYK-6]|uniref:hypothetical protein n=1 Tax=Sphingobium sp. (strain NBRC 103272 / SYK-6) TaxID=627192 RepID=UPI0011D19AC8|nr:hypothetical protein [Sphingobium sp. SYK-6]
MADFGHRGLPSGAVQGADRRVDVTLEAKATRMHMLGRLRTKHFYAPVMADTAMDVMLSLYVGELQSGAVSDTALALANMLSRNETDAIIDKLVQAELAVTTGQEPEGRTVGLTPLGSARMRSFVNDYPEV